MSVLRRAAPVSVALFAGRLGGAGLAFATQALIARSWGAAVLGDYLFALAVSNLAAAAMPLGFQAVGGYFAARYRAAGSRRSLWAYLAQGYAQTALLAVCFIAAAAAATALADPSASMRGLWLPAVVTAVAIAVVYLNGSVLAGLRRPVAALAADTLLRPMLMFASFAAVALILSPARPLVPMLWLMAIGYGLVAVAQTAVLVSTVRNVADDRAMPTDQRRQWWRYALPWAVIGLATDFFFDIDLVLLAPFLNREDLAVFGVCARVCTLLAFGVGTVYTVMMPDILDAGVSRDEAKFRARIDEANGVAAVLAVLCAVAMFASGPLLAFVFGPQFHAAALPLGIMALGLVFRAAFGPAPLVLSFYDRPFASVPAAAAGLVALAVADLALVPAFGLPGAALAATIAMAAWSVAQWATARRTLGIDVSLYPRLRRFWTGVQRRNAIASRIAQRRMRGSVTPLS